MKVNLQNLLMFSTGFYYVYLTDESDTWAMQRKRRDKLIQS